MTDLPANSTHMTVPPGSPGLRTDDLQRIAVALDAEVAQSTRTTNASGWRSWDRADVGFDSHGLPITIRRSKTDQEAQGQTRVRDTAAFTKQR